MMLVQQLKERIVEGSIYCICKNQSQNSAFQLSENLHFDNLFYPHFSACIRSKKDYFGTFCYLLAQMCSMQTLRVLNMISIPVPPIPVQLSTGLWSA